MRIPGLRAAASVVRDVDGVPHIKAPTRTTCSSCRAGSARRRPAVPDGRDPAAGVGHARRAARQQRAAERRPDADVRAAAYRRSAACRCCRARPRTDLRAYADGVNAWIARNELPGQYAARAGDEGRAVDAWWTACSSIKLLAFSLSFDLDIDRTTAVQALRRGRSRRSHRGVPGPRSRSRRSTPRRR